MSFIFFFLLSVIYASAQDLDTNDSIPFSKKQDEKIDTLYLYDDGIPWNREFFDRNSLLKRHAIDPALTIAYTYSLRFFSGPFGKFSEQSYLAHLAYEFSPELHLYADLGLWMPLYVHFNGPKSIAREDIKQGNVQFVIPDVELEYKPSQNTTFRLMFINERDAFKAYGPRWYRW